MKIILVLLFFLALAFADIGRLTSQQEEDAIKLYKSLCSNQREGGSNRDTTVYCEYPIDPPQNIITEHEIRADGVGTASEQVVFVRPQSKIYTHQVTLTGTSEHNQDTTIYVLPQNDQHEIAVKDQRVTTTKGDKPRLYFLSRDPYGNDGSPQQFSRSPIISSISDDRDFRPFSHPTFTSSNSDTRDFRPFSSSPVVRNFDDREFRPAFSSSSLVENVKNFDDRDFRPTFSRSPIISSSSDNQGSGDTRITFSTS